SAAIRYLETFCEDVAYLYRDKYLSQPTVDATQKLLDKACTRGFPGISGSVDCTR
ncbi:hypothetical protein CROQUDRAFT_44232, partial [Cronartium quercuum f. sp. fusiforme G11]